MNELNVYRDYKDLKSTKNILIKISEILKNHLSFETCKRELLLKIGDFYVKLDIF